MLYNNRLNTNTKCNINAYKYTRYQFIRQTNNNVYKLPTYQKRNAIINRSKVQ